MLGLGKRAPQDYGRASSDGTGVSTSALFLVT
jgi:hypothetical protein